MADHETSPWNHTTTFVSPSRPYWEGEGNQASQGKYGDDTWKLRDLVPVGDPEDGGVARWLTVPINFREELRYSLWLLLNDGAPDSFVHLHGFATRARTTVNGTYRSFLAWRAFAYWLDKKGLTSLNQITSRLLEDFADEAVRIPALKRGAAKIILLSVSRLWAVRQVVYPSQSFSKPPWYGKVNLADYLPKEHRNSENRTRVIPIATVGAMMTWALRYIDDFADDIFAARAERDRIISSAKARGTVHRGENVFTVFDRARTAGASLEGFSATHASAIYVSGHFDVPLSQAERFIRDESVIVYGQSHPGGMPLRIRKAALSARTERPWGSAIDFKEMNFQWSMLQTAAAIVVGYLTGMRTGEVLSLRRGCCTPHPTREAQWIIRGRPSKKTSERALSGDGEGSWVAIEPVHRAIKLLEKMSSGQSLFEAISSSGKPRREGEIIHPITLNNRLSEFVGYIAARDGDGNIGFEDGTPVTFGMLRRTLAYYIARRPNGHVALAVQYNHMRTTTSEGYASRRTDGFPDMVRTETARASIEILATVLSEPELVNGLAAARLRVAAAKADIAFPGLTLTDREARQLTEQPEFRVYSNPQMFAKCHFDPNKALCARTPDLAETNPVLGNCQPQCANIARTPADRKAAALHADFLESVLKEGVAPFLATRLETRIASLRTVADVEIS